MPTAPLINFLERSEQIAATVSGRQKALFTKTLASVDPAAVAGFQARYAEKLSSFEPNAEEKFADIPLLLSARAEFACELDLDRETRPLAILDIGAGPGHFLALCKSCGHSTEGIDVDNEFYSGLRSILGITCRIDPVVRQKPIATFERRFDLITIIWQTFDKVFINPDGSRIYWTMDDWIFLIGDLLDNHLKPAGRIHIRLNPEIQHDVRTYKPALLDWCEHRGAEVNRDAGIMTLLRS